MLQLKHKKLIVDACYPANEQEAIEYWHDIKPVKFGNTVTWAGLPALMELATYEIPEDASYLLVLRTECYVYTDDNTDPSFRQFQPPPTGEAYWQYSDVVGGTISTGLAIRLTPRVPVHILCDTEEFLLGKGDNRIVLQAELAAAPGVGDLLIRTLVYGYLIGALVAGKIGDSESTYYSQS